jgi:hypothetical protein
MWFGEVLRWFLRLLVIGLLIVDLAGLAEMLEFRRARLEAQAPGPTWSTNSTQAITIAQLEEALLVSSAFWLVGAVAEIGSQAGPPCFRRYLVFITVPVAINVALETGLFAQSGFASDLLPIEYFRLTMVWFHLILRLLDFCCVRESSAG